jgi:protein phosphatase 1L
LFSNILREVRNNYISCILVWSKFTSEKWHSCLILISQEGFWDDPTLSISKAYESTDQAILSHSSDLGHGGSTAVTAILIDGRRLWIANVGDSRAVVSRKRQAVQMTIDHEPNTERGSIETRGGFVSNLPGNLNH